MSGMRPTGPLHIGHYLGVLVNWLDLQEDYQCYFEVADWHALTTGYESTGNLRENVRNLVMDWLSVGIDPEKSVVFRQSDVKEHAELHLLLSMLTPLGWLERVPTYKEQLQQLSDRAINTYGFLGYPVLMASDILIYKADTVPVGEDQLPHMELTREMARRFNYLYGEIFPEPQAKLTQVPLLAGTDGRKMSKSYGNYISLSDTADKVVATVSKMITDPERIHKNDPGHPDICTAYSYHKVFSAGDPVFAALENECRAGSIGCVQCKKHLAEVMNQRMEPFRARRKELEADPGLVDRILDEGAQKARDMAATTLKEVRNAMHL